MKEAGSGDFNHVAVEEVETLAGGDASGRVQRYKGGQTDA